MQQAPDAQPYAQRYAPPEHLSARAVRVGTHASSIRAGVVTRMRAQGVLDSFVSVYDWEKQVDSDMVTPLPPSSCRMAEARATALVLEAWPAHGTKQRLYDGLRCGVTTDEGQEHRCGNVGCQHIECYRLAHDNRITSSREAVEQAQRFADHHDRPLILITLNFNWRVPANEGSTAPPLSPLGGAANTIWLRGAVSRTPGRNSGSAGKNLLLERLGIIQTARNKFRDAWRRADLGPVWWWTETAWRATRVAGQRWLPQPHIHALVSPPVESLARWSEVDALWGGCSSPVEKVKPMLSRMVSPGEETTRRLGRYLAKGSTGTSLARLDQGPRAPAIRCSDLASHLDDRSVYEWVEALDGPGYKSRMMGSWSAPTDDDLSYTCQRTRDLITSHLPDVSELLNDEARLTDDL